MRCLHEVVYPIGKILFLFLCLLKNLRKKLKCYRGCYTLSTSYYQMKAESLLEQWFQFIGSEPSVSTNYVGDLYYTLGYKSKCP